MLSKYKLSVKAQADIKNIFRYSYQEFGQAQALKYRTNLEYCFQLLADTPEIGRKYDAIREGYQRHEHERHVVFYRKRNNDILIVRVLHENMAILRHL